MSGKESDEVKEQSEANTINSGKNIRTHCTASRGYAYARKIQDWEGDEEQLTQSGVMAYASNWDPRSVRFLLGRRVTFNPDGSLSYWDAATEEFAQRTKAVHEEVANGTFKPNRENDQLT